MQLKNARINRTAVTTAAPFIRRRRHCISHPNRTKICCYRNPGKPVDAGSLCGRRTANEPKTRDNGEEEETTRAADVWRLLYVFLSILICLIVVHYSSARLLNIVCIITKSESWRISTHYSRYSRSEHVEYCPQNMRYRLFFRPRHSGRALCIYESLSIGQ